MTIASQTSRISYIGDGSTTAFAVPFFFAADADLKVYLQSSSGAQALKVLGTDYSLSGAGVSSGGTCTFTIAPTSTTGAVVTIYRDPQVTQTTSYNNNDPFPAKSHEAALDKLTTLEQRTRDMITRAVQLPDSDPVLDMHMPTVVNRQNKLLGFDTNGLPVGVLGPTFVNSTYISTALVDTRSTAAITSFANTVNAVSVRGLATAWDGGAANYKRVVSQPSHAGKFQSADGAWWEILSDGGRLYPEMFSTTADTSAIQTAMDVANSIGATVVQLGNNNYRAAKQGSNDYCLRVYGPVSLLGGASLRDGASAGHGAVFSWGSGIDTSTDIVKWESTDFLSGCCISGIRWMPDGFNANAADISALTKFGRNGLVITGAGQFKNCHVNDCLIGPMNSGRSISIPSNGNWIDGVIDNNEIWGGVYAPTCGDNCRFSQNASLGVNVAFELGNASGAGTMIVGHNHGIPAGGALLLRSGFKVKVVDNFFEQAVAHSGSGYLYDLPGTDGTLQSVEFKGNVAGTVGNKGLTGMVRFANSIKSDIDSNTLIGDASVTYPIYIDATNLNPICGQVSGGGIFITESIYNQGYYVASAATVAPIGYDVPLTLSNGWTTLTGGYEIPRVRRLPDGTCIVSGDISSGTVTSGTTFATLPAATYYPKHNCIRVGPNSGSGVVTFNIASGSGNIGLRSAGDASGMGISFSYTGAPVN